MSGRHSELRVSASNIDDACLLDVEGVLDATTYVALREAIVRAALDEPRVLIVDVTGLAVREDPAWAVFTSARWQIADWPDVPIGIVSAREQDRNALQRNGIARYVPAYASRETAIAEMTSDASRRYRRYARAMLGPSRHSIRYCRELIGKWLTDWSRADFIHVASLVATELAEAAMAATDIDFALRLETDGSTVSVAVQHVGIANQQGRKSVHDNVSGLDLVDANSRSWGTYTTLTGNTLWAVVGPENRF